jgi:hypothetical protein
LLLETYLKQWRLPSLQASGVKREGVKTWRCEHRA